MINSELVLVRGESQLWFYHGLAGWSTSLGGAYTYPNYEAAEKAIARRQVRGKWGNVGYLTIGEAKEKLAALKEAQK
jgi:hypothetical protein